MSHPRSYSATLTYVVTNTEPESFAGSILSDVIAYAYRIDRGVVERDAMRLAGELDRLEAGDGEANPLPVKRVRCCRECCGYAEPMTVAQVIDFGSDGPCSRCGVLLERDRSFSAVFK